MVPEHRRRHCSAPFLGLKLVTTAWLLVSTLNFACATRTKRPRTLDWSRSSRESGTSVRERAPVRARRNGRLHERRCCTWQVYRRHGMTRRSRCSTCAGHQEANEGGTVCSWRGIITRNGVGGGDVVI